MYKKFAVFLTIAVILLAGISSINLTLAQDAHEKYLSGKYEAFPSGAKIHIQGDVFDISAGMIEEQSAIFIGMNRGEITTVSSSIEIDRTTTIGVAYSGVEMEEEKEEEKNCNRCVQIGAETKKQTAMTLVERAKKELGRSDVYIDYIEGYYKVRVGRNLDQLEADRLRDELNVKREAWWCKGPKDYAWLPLDCCMGEVEPKVKTEKEHIWIKEAEGEEFKITTDSPVSIAVSEDIKLKINNALILESNSFKKTNVEIVNSEIISLDIKDFSFNELLLLSATAKLGKNSEVSLPVNCPKISLDQGGMFEINKKLFTFLPAGNLKVHSEAFKDFEFAPEEKEVIFMAEKEPETGCTTKIVPEEFTSEFIKNIKGEVFFSFKLKGLKIASGEVEIDGTTVAGKNIYFFIEKSQFDDFAKNEELKKANSAFFFDEETKTLSMTLSDNFNGHITTNGQEIKFADGKPKKVVPNFVDIYELGKQRKVKVLSDLLENKRKRLSKKDGSCEEFGGEWQENECSSSFMIGGIYNKFTHTKITDYKPGKFCCIKLVPIAREIRHIETTRGLMAVVPDQNIVGRNVFSAPEGTIIVDVAPQFLKNDVEKVLGEAFDESFHLPISLNIQVNDLKAEVPDYRGAYTPKFQKIEVTRNALGSSNIIHEMLHSRFYSDEETKEAITATLIKYMEDRYLTKEEKKTREDLSYRLTDWIESYKPSSVEEYQRKITGNEGHSVIGQWLYEKYAWGWHPDLKFPPYVLALYENILRPEIIAEGA